MKRKIKSHVKVIMLFCVALLMFNCEKEENASNQVESKIQTVTIDEAKNFLTHSKTNSFGKTANNGLENLELDKISQEKINGSDQLLTVIPLVTNNSFQSDRILLLKVNNEIKSVVFTMYPDEDSDKGSFSGELYSHTLEGNFISGFRAKDGVIVSCFVEDNNTKSTAVTGKAIRLREVVVQNNLVYALDVFGPTSLFGNDMYGGYNNYSGVEYYSWDAAGGGGAGSTNTSPTITAISIQKQIYTDKLPPCLKKVLDDLIKIYAGPGNMIVKFVGNDPSFDYNWNMETGINNYGVSGRTLPETYGATKGIKTIYDINQFPNATELSWAKTILHESIHAYLITYFYRDEPSFETDYPVLFQKYMDRKEWNGNHHEEIATNLVKSVGDALEAYGISKGYKLNKQFYQDMAWGGLEQTDVFAKLSLADRRRISDTLSIELRGEDDYGNKKTQKGKKAGC
ncbi:hypothetical protein [Flavobacterium notoginsengisoli]|uniref:hypothetical protein n=1 Tax=Flavobacterium notoginsengisoli TaxID=1478199 RepID=UPI0036326E30